VSEKITDNIETSGITEKIGIRSTWLSISLRQKIFFAVASLLIMACLSTVFTLSKLAVIEQDAHSLIGSQEPILVKYLQLSQNVNYVLSLLHEIINSNRSNEKIDYQEVEADILLFIGYLRSGERSRLPTQKAEELQSLLYEFVTQSRKIVSLSYNFDEKFPGIYIANEKLNPLSSEYLGSINEIIALDDLQEQINHKKEVHDLLTQLRYSWLQVTNNFRRSYISQIVTESFNSYNLFNSLDDNKRILQKLENMGVEIGFGNLERLREIHQEFSTSLRQVLDIQANIGWRADLKVMKMSVKPAARKLRKILDEQVQLQMMDSINIGLVITDNLRQIRTYSAMLLVASILIGLLVTWVIVRAICPPLEKLMQAADKVSRGDLNSEVFIMSNDEVGKLSRSFNQMVDNLRTAEIDKYDHLISLEKMNKKLELRVTERTSELEKSETRIRTIHNSVGEAILVFGKNHRIETINRAGLNIFACDEIDIIGKHASILFRSLYNPDADMCINVKQFLGLMTTHKTMEVEGVRRSGEVFPMDLLVSKMSHEESDSLVCIVRDITGRKKAEEHLVAAQKEIVNAAHKSGMAEMATGVLHNIGNILNSVNISVEEISRVARNSKVIGLLKANTMLADNMNDISDFIANDSKGRKLPRYYVKLGGIIDDEFDTIKREVAVLSQKTTMMKEVISTQQSYAAAGFLSETFGMTAIIDDALVVQKSSLEKWGVKILVSIDDIPLISAQKSRLLQVVTNLIKNANEAMQDNDVDNREKILTITAGVHNARSVYVCVADTGCGVTEANLSKIFQHGFTTKDSGHGFGLHASANAMTEMGGTLSIRSEGVGLGSSFTLVVPVANFDHVGVPSTEISELRKAI